MVDLHAFIDDADDDVGATACPLPGALDPEPIERCPEAALADRWNRHDSSSATRAQKVTLASELYETKIQRFFARLLLADPERIGPRAKLFAVDHHFQAHGR